MATPKLNKEDYLSSEMLKIPIKNMFFPIQVRMSYFPDLKDNAGKWQFFFKNFNLKTRHLWKKLKIKNAQQYC
jgi:hypothetical protein